MSYVMSKRGRFFVANPKSTFVMALAVLSLLLSGVVVKGDWESDANARIEANRKRDAQITVWYTDNNPVPDVSVQIEQIKHLFAFGTCLANSKMSNNSYKNFVLNHFEWAVCENESKWEWNESSRDTVYYTDADNIYTWCNNNDIIMRGHCLFWEQPSHVQTWVKDLPYATYPTSSELLDEVDERIDGAVNHFKNKFVHWDVDNEMLSDSFYDRLGEAGRVHMFQAASAKDPGCLMMMNEYSGNSFGGYDGWTYASRANSLISDGAPIDGLGIQGHMNSPVSAAQYYSDVLVPLAAVGLPIIATEFDVSVANVTQRANDIENYFRICFSHPDVIGVIMWGFWQGAMWRTDGYMVDNSWNINAAGLRYEAILDEWTTSDSDTTNSSGNATYRGFHGTYEITLSLTGYPDEVHTIELEPGSGTQTFILETNFPPPYDTTPPNPNPMTWSSNPAATGPTSITMTATTATDSQSPPVEYYFDCTSHTGHDSDWQTSTTYVATGLNPGTTYSFRVQARDSSAAQNETVWSSTEYATTDSPDTTPPTPDPMTWASLPTATGMYSITMTATTATDSQSPPVEYYFDCTSHTGHDSGWQTSTTYEATGLDAGTLYSFRVQARDSSAAQNTTGWSSTLPATTDPPDLTPPNPNPMTWLSEPTLSSSNAITMTASTATDSESPPVEYYFECTTDGDFNSTWQSSPTYEATGLDYLTTYNFRVKARDSAPALNETGWSNIKGATTEPQPTDIEIIGSWATGTTHAKESGTSRGLIFIAHAEDDVAITLNSVTYGGQPMTLVIDRTTGTSGYRAYAAAYILDEAGVAAATSDTFNPTWSTTPENVSYASVFLSNVNQTTTIGATASNSTTSSTPNPITTAALSTNDGDMVIDAAVCGNTGDYTLLNGFTEALEHDMSSSTGSDGYKSATGADETPSAQHSNVNRQVIIGFVIQAMPSIVDYPPAAPTGLVATAGNEVVSLDWNDNEEPDMNGYNVYRSTDEGGPYTDPPLNGSLLTSSDYIDDTVTNEITYYYVVTAVDANDNESADSNEDWATPTSGDPQNCPEVQLGGYRLASDFNFDCYVDYGDIEVITYYWLSTDCGIYSDCEHSDFEPDGDVDSFDYSNFAQQWMWCNDPEDTGCTSNW